MAKAEATDSVFAALAAPARRSMLEMLARGETPVSEVADKFEMTLSAVSQHLAILKEAGLVTQRRDGRQRLYRLNPEPLHLVSDWLTQYEPFWTDRLRRLGDYLDAGEDQQ